MEKSLRHRILENMVQVFSGVDEPDYPLKFSVVELGPLGEADHRKRYSIGFVAVGERYKHQFPYLECFLRVGIEYRITVNQGDPSPGDMAETLLTVIKQVVLANETWCGLAIKTEFQNTETDMTTYGDRTVMGVLWVEVHYRHAHGDPTDPYPSV